MESRNPKLSIIDLTNLHFVICGAAITIQNAWRIYKLKKSSHKLNEIKIEKPIKTQIETQFSKRNVSSINELECDVEIVVDHTETFLCHSIVLWCNSGYFRSRLSSELASKQNFLKYKFEFSNAISIKCWKLLMKYFYGYEIEINNRQLFNEILTASNLLDIKGLKIELNNKMQSRVNDDLATNNDCFNRPLQFISNYYSFFKCVLSFYLKKKLNLHETQLYLSSKFINYEKMNEIEIKKCIYLLKTRLKLQNKSLLTDLINIFLKKKLRFN